MKLFSCDNCKQLLFFENNRCMSCGMSVAYCLEAGRLVALKPIAEGESVYEIEVEGRPRRYRSCKNAAEGACNWLIADESEATYCRSCALTEIIPDLGDEGNRRAWTEIEAAKRRLLYTIFVLELPLCSKLEDAQSGLAFRFMNSTPESPVMTGHNEGIITLNVAEADSAFRENMREKMGEAYRTVLGHLRHEIGHYYWDRLVGDRRPQLEKFREEFGDERASYQEAIERHYDEGPPADWSDSYISAYATMHPWEDWAETWAHYMHLVDTLETAKSHGLAVVVPGAGERIATDALAFGEFESLLQGWHAVTLALNSLSRSMGVKDVYPFVLSPRVQKKLRFVHDVIQGARSRSPQSKRPKKTKGASPAARAVR